MRRLVAALLLAGLLPALAAQEGGVRKFDRAERLELGGSTIPDEAWDWTPGVLPHNWYADPPPYSQLWYRLRFSLDHAPYRGHSLYLGPRLAP